MGFEQQWTKMRIPLILLVTIVQFQFLSAFELDTVKELVQEWSPLVWLAPGEKFMPGNVEDFLKHVHPELPLHKPGIYDVNEHPDKYIEYMNDIKEIQELQSSLITNRIKRNYKNPLNPAEGNLPTGDESEKWYLVTNKNLDELRTNSESFIFGQDPNKNMVPIYAVISSCARQPISEFDPIVNEITIDRKTYKVVSDPPDRNKYIPLKARSLNFPLVETASKKPNLNVTRNNETVEIVMAITVNETYPVDLTPMPAPSFVESKEITNKTENVTTTSTTTTTPEPKWAVKEGVDWKPSMFNQKPPETFDGFHVTYWMFYPYSQGKIMCSIDLGVLGPIPIPLIFGFCFGEKKEFGSHIGDWEHVSLFFSGQRKEPEEMYVSAHDAGAYYSFNSRNRIFEFRKQETRKGIFQKPSFPKIVRTSKNHPVLFSAEGSHGLWTAPGKHRYVRVPRLYDINGFGIPWTTWDNINFFFSDKMEKDESTPNWLKFRGKWGNQKSKCHPLTRVGLHLCEISDGPTGIPRKKPHFKCSSKSSVSSI